MVKMYRRDSETRIRSATASVFHLLQSAQIEHQGQYSVQRLRYLQCYISKKFTFSRLAILLFATPLPSVAIIILTEFLPLNLPSKGPHDNAALWARFTIVTIVIAICFTTTACFAVPAMKLSLSQGSIVVICATAVAVGTAYTLSVRIGFPVPFMMPIVAIPFIGSLWILMGVFSFRRLFADSNTIQSLKEWINVSGLVATQLLLYPLFNYTFRIASASEQTALSFFLGIVKIGYRFAVGKIIKQQADEKAEIVTFNAEIGHAIFVTFSMQNATSIMTAMVLLGIDILHSSSVIYDVHAMVTQLKRLDRAIHIHEKEPLQGGNSVVDCAIAMISRENIDQGPGFNTIKSHSPRYVGNGTRIKRLCGRLLQTEQMNTAKIRVSPSTGSMPVIATPNTMPVNVLRSERGEIYPQNTPLPDQNETPFRSNWGYLNRVTRNIRREPKFKKCHCRSQHQC